MIRQVTAKDRYARSLRAVEAWCKVHRHRPLLAQHEHLVRMIRGHYAYYGVTGNSKRLKWYRHQVERLWKRWLTRRSRERDLNWERMRGIFDRYPLPSVRIVHQWSQP